MILVPPLLIFPLFQVLTPIKAQAYSITTSLKDSPIWNSAHDKSGNLLFFIQGDSVYDRDGYLIDALGAYSQVQSPGYVETSIIPRPGRCNQFYIIFWEYPSGSVGWNYYVLDMDAPNRWHPGKKGKFEWDSNGFPEAHFISGGSNHTNIPIAISKLRPPTNDRLLFISDSYSFSRYKITESGIVNDNYQFSFPNGVSTSQQIDFTENELIELNSGGYRFACKFDIHSGPGLSGIYIFDLDQDGNILSQKRIPFPTNVNSIRVFLSGLEFSPNGNYIYFTGSFAPLHMVC